jgi:hypothetical protein
MQSAEALYQGERRYRGGDPASVPELGICFSGGGNRSAAFAIGVLRALHENGLLAKADVISAVSGGTYALSWLLLQPFQHRAGRPNPRAALDTILNQMFDLDGAFQRYLVNSAKPLEAGGWIGLAGLLALMLPFDLAIFNALRLVSAPLSFGSNAARAANLLNAQSMARQSYRAGIQRTYQVFPDTANQVAIEPRSFSTDVLAASQHLRLTRRDVPPVSFPALSEFGRRAGLPAYVFNATVCPPAPGMNGPLGDRIFELGAIGFGSDSCGYMTWEETEAQGWEPGMAAEKGWMLRDQLASPFATLRSFNVASAISGAALSGTGIEARRPRALLRMLNLGLEYVVPSPGDRRRAVRLSDGGHSENLGAWALLRRRCRTILIVDAEHDPSYRFGAYRKLKQAARQELGIEIAVSDLDRVLDGSGAFERRRPIVEGTTTDQRSQGRLFYLKLSMHQDWVGDQGEVIARYAGSRRQFPQEPTSDQYFEPAQFIAYRALGYAVGRTFPAL